MLTVIMEDKNGFFERCEECMYYFFGDGEEDGCTAPLDEDDIAGMYGRGRSRCPFFRGGDEYQIVKKQI